MEYNAVGIDVSKGKSTICIGRPMGEVVASIKERNGKYCVIYTYTDESGNKKQKWETYKTKAEAKQRKKEIEYKEGLGQFIIPQCKYLRELLDEYVSLYGRDKWSLSTYDRNTDLINNYIRPMIGDTKISDITTRYLEKYYQQLLKTPAVPTVAPKKNNNALVGTSTIRDVHKILRSCFEQAVKWELMEKNPAIYATVPKYKPNKRRAQRMINVNRILCIIKPGKMLQR